MGRGLGAMTREDSGERRGALVRFGSARRETVAWRGLSRGWEAADIRPTALGVGVAGKGIGVTGGFCVRRFWGVVGAAVETGVMLVLSAFTLSVTSAAFRLRERLAAGDGGGGGIGAVMPPFPLSNAPIRADLRVAIFSAVADEIGELGI